VWDFPSWIQIPLSQWIDTVMHWVLTHWSAFFDAVSNIFLHIMLPIERFLLWLPWWVVVLVVGIVAWRAMRSKVAGLIMMAFLIIIGSFGHSTGASYWDAAMSTLAIVIASVIISLVIGIPTGILMATSDRFEKIIRPVLDAMQTMPSFVYLIPALMLFGLGMVPAVFAAAEAFGSSKRQILFDVQIPLAIPSIMVGINQTTMMALAMVVIASMIGARGLGQEVLLAINRIQIGRGFEAGLSIVLLAIIIDRITNAMASRQQYELNH